MGKPLRVLLRGRCGFFSSKHPSEGVGAVAYLLLGGWTEADTFFAPVPPWRLRLLGAQVLLERPAGAGKLVFFMYAGVGSRG